MPVAVEMRFDATLEQYDEVIRRMGYEPDSYLSGPGLAEG